MRWITRWCSLLCVLMAGSLTQASAQPAGRIADLVLPQQAQSLSFFSSLGMGIWKPEGDGPFPALILLHTCGGVSQHIGTWRKEAITRGYLVMILDSFSARGSPSCRPRAPIPMERGVQDISDAVAHLAALPGVDPNRIGVMGFSWGGMAALLNGSTGYRAATPINGRTPTAVVSVYPSCYIGPFGSFPGAEFLRQDLATPTLVLMGAADTESPPQDCLDRLTQLRERRAPVEWEVIPDATHCWDCQDKHGYRSSPPWAGGRTVEYRYDGKATGLSIERAFAFLAQRMPAR